MEDLTGKQLGSYQIVAPLGEGGMAAVYKAYQPAMERYVAVKVLPRHMASSEEFVARFRREAKLLAQLQHPHILPVFDYGEADGYPYIVMPFIYGGTLAELLQKRHLTLLEIRRIMTQVGDALGYAHACGMMHRDIKPSNILIDERGNCLLTDFGLARMTEAVTKLTTSGTIMGTPAYMSPEQGAGSTTDHRSDIYSLGIILYEMVTGRVPYIAETPVAVVFKHIQDPLPSARKFNPSLSESLELVLLKALAKNPEERFQSAEDFVCAVQKAIPEDASTDKTLLHQPTYAATVVAQAISSEGETKIAEVQPLPEVQTIPSQTPAAPLETKVEAVKSPVLDRFPVWMFAGIGAIVLGAIAVFAVMRSGGTNNIPTVQSTNIVSSTKQPINSPLPKPTSAPALELRPGPSFADGFDGHLAEGWTWIAEDPAKWSLSAVNGALQIIASNRNFSSPNPPANILLRDGPDGDFEITTSLRFTPTRNFQFAGLVVFQDNKNALQYGRAFCNTQNACKGDGVYFDNIENGSAVGSNASTSFHGPAIFLRLRRVGNIYTGYYSEDGQNWIMTGEHVRDFSHVHVGLIAAQSSTEIPAVFDSFLLDQPSTTTARVDLDCRALPDTDSEIRTLFKSGMTMPVRGFSIDYHWLSIQNPINAKDFCWIPFDSSSLSPNAINVNYGCVDPLGCVYIAPGAPFHIAMWGVLSGANAALGQDAMHGIEIAINDRGGKIHGHNILLTTDDALCTEQGGGAAAQKIASDKTIVALIGSICSQETTGGIAALTRAGLTTISPSNTHSSLTDPNRGPDYAGFLRTAPNDSVQGRLLAEFAYNFLKVRKAAIIHDESGYSKALQQVFVDRFTQLGGQIVAQEAISSGDTDMHGVLTRLAVKRPDLIYYPVFVAAGGHITAQIKDVPGLENATLVASDGVFTPEFLQIAGLSVQGVYISSPDFGRFPSSYGALAEKYRNKYGTPPVSNYHAHAYDAANMIFDAVQEVGIVGSDGAIYIPRKALRDAIYATRDFNGVTGVLTCSPSGDCGNPLVAVYQVVNPDPAAWNPQDASNPNPRRIFP